MATRAPSLAKRRQVAPPMPPAPPVTTTVFWSKRCMMSFRRCGGGNAASSAAAGTQVRQYIGIMLHSKVPWTQGLNESRRIESPDGYWVGYQNRIGQPPVLQTLPVCKYVA